MIFRIHPLNLIKALSMAFEISSGGHSSHHLRTAVIAGKLAIHLGSDMGKTQELIYSALLHDIGAASILEEKNQLGTLRMSTGMYKHAVTGYELFLNTPQLKNLADVILHHHDCFDGSSPSGFRGEEIPLNSRFINLADRIEILINNADNIFDQKEHIVSSVKSLDGYFDPQIMKAFDELAEQESFWLDIVNPYYQHSFIDNIGASTKLRFDIDDILSVAGIFATIVNRMSPFTAQHSHRVADVSELLAKIKGYSADEVKMMRVAGLFHDLGKLSVPNGILDKPGALTSKEFLIIKQHPYYTYRILEQIDGFGIIAEWAAFHHEMLDGCGYPFRIKRDSLKLGSRIVAVADVFVALTEDRPYRAGLSIEETAKIMHKMAANGKLDRSLIQELFDNPSLLQETQKRSY